MNHFDWLVFDWLAILCVDFGVCRLLPRRVAVLGRA